jgi:hypothetical protein
MFLGGTLWLVTNRFMTTRLQICPELVYTPPEFAPQKVLASPVANRVFRLLPPWLPSSTSGKFDLMMLQEYAMRIPILRP